MSLTVLLLEKIHDVAEAQLKEAGFTVRRVNAALKEDERPSPWPSVFSAVNRKSLGSTTEDTEDSENRKNESLMSKNCCPQSAPL
jgi:hypothetical protein